MPEDTKDKPPLVFPPNWREVRPGPGTVISFVGAEAFRRQVSKPPADPVKPQTPPKQSPD